MHSSGMRTARSSSRPGGVSTRHPPGPHQTPPGEGTPLGAGTLPGPGTPRHTPVNILPCPKLRLRAVIRPIHEKSANRVKMYRRLVAPVLRIAIQLFQHRKITKQHTFLINCSMSSSESCCSPVKRCITCRRSSLDIISSPSKST